MAGSIRLCCSQDECPGDAETFDQVQYIPLVRKPVNARTPEVETERIGALLEFYSSTLSINRSFQIH